MFVVVGVHCTCATAVWLGWSLALLVRAVVLSVELTSPMRSMAGRVGALIQGYKVACGAGAPQPPPTPPPTTLTCFLDRPRSFSHFSFLSCPLIPLSDRTPSSRLFS